MLKLTRVIQLAGGRPRIRIQSLRFQGPCLFPSTMLPITQCGYTMWSAAPPCKGIWARTEMLSTSSALLVLRP